MTNNDAREQLLKEINLLETFIKHNGDIDNEEVMAAFNDTWKDDPADWKEVKLHALRYSNVGAAELKLQLKREKLRKIDHPQESDHDDTWTVLEGEDPDFSTTDYDDTHEYTTVRKTSYKKVNQIEKQQPENKNEPQQPEKRKPGRPKKDRIKITDIAPSFDDLGDWD